MPKLTIKKITAMIDTDGVKIIGSDIATAHSAVTQWSNDPTKRRANYSELRVAHVAALIAIARIGSGNVKIDASEIVDSVTVGKWNDGAALARYLRNDGIAGCAGIEPLRIRQTRISRGLPVFAVTVD
jgi:hypothetical protein|tara:strand:+ start:780 stop:1163 length:384 start_codon:yes stop_codon:yes gene_type:complete